MPRRQHYFFAHRILPGLFFRDPAGFARAMERDGNAVLRRLWRRSGSFWNRLFGRGNVALSRRALPDGSALLVIAPPAPLRTTEAHFVGLLLAPKGEAAVFTLERHDSMDGEVTTVLGGWIGEGHANYGEGPKPTVDAFAEAVWRLRQPEP